ncbi:MAG TPA: hypothetical protein DDZ91_02115 [Firmicutes bacterium]|nr:hypothetical protein [Bacillota bacterium]
MHNYFKYYLNKIQYIVFTFIKLNYKIFNLDKGEFMVEIIGYHGTNKKRGKDILNNNKMKLSFGEYS